MAPIIQLSPEMSAAQNILAGGNPLAGLVPDSGTPDYVGPTPVAGGPASAPAPISPALSGQPSMAQPEEPKIGVSEGFGQQMARIADSLTKSNPQALQQPGGWARSLVGAAQSALSGLGDTSTKPGGGILAGVSETLANRNNRIAEQKQQQFNNQRQLNTEQREKERNDALIAHTNLENYHTQLLIHRGIEDDEAKNNNIENGKKDDAAMASGDVPAALIREKISSDELQKLLQEGKVSGHEYAYFPVDRRETGKDPKTGLTDHETLFNVREIPKSFTWTKEAAAEANKFAPTDTPIIPGTVTNGPEAYHLMQRARSNEAAQMAVDKNRRENDLEEFKFENEKAKNDHLKRIDALQPDLTNVLGKTRNDPFKAAIEFQRNPALAQKYPNAVEDIMDIYGGPKEWEAMRHNREEEAVKRVELAAKTFQDVGNPIMTDDMKAAIATLPKDKQQFLSKYTPEEQGAILSMGLSPGNMDFKEVFTRMAKGQVGLTPQRAENAIAQVFPGWTIQQYNTMRKKYLDITSGMTGKDINRYNNVLKHAAEAQTVINDASRNGPAFYNTALNKLENTTYGNQARAIQSALLPVREEYQELLKAGKAGHEDEAAQYDTILNPNSTPQAIATAFSIIGGVGARRLETLNSEFKRASRGKNLPGILDKDAVESAAKLNLDDTAKKILGRLDVGGTLFDNPSWKAAADDEIQRQHLNETQHQEAREAIARMNAPKGSKGYVIVNGNAYYNLNGQIVDEKGQPATIPTVKP